MTMIADMLLAKEPLFDNALHQLEAQSHHKGMDTKLAAEIVEKAADRMKQIGLDANCTPQELYAALDAKIAEHDEHFCRALGGTEPDNVAQMLPLVVKGAQAVKMNRAAFVLKEDVAKAMLRHTPPMNIMKRLGYLTVEDMLHKENLFEIFLAIRFAEDPEWLNRFDHEYYSLKGTDFTEREIKVVPFDLAKWGDIADHFIQKKLHNITHSKEMGAIAVMPMTIERMPGISLKAFSLIIHYYNEVRLYSAFFKLMQHKHNFGQILAETLIADTPNLPLMAGQTVHWRVIQRYFGKLKDDGHPEMFEPHVHPEDLHWRKAEDVMYEVDPELEFWKDLDYVAVIKGGDTVTFNMMDVSFGYSNKIPYAERYLYHFRESLWNEVFARYMGADNLREQLLEKLDNAMVKPEELKLS